MKVIDRMGSRRSASRVNCGVSWKARGQQRAPEGPCPQCPRGNVLHLTVRVDVLAGILGAVLQDAAAVGTWEGAGSLCVLSYDCGWLCCYLGRRF